MAKSLVVDLLTDNTGCLPYSWEFFEQNMTFSMYWVSINVSVLQQFNPGYKFIAGFCKIQFNTALPASCLTFREISGFKTDHITKCTDVAWPNVVSGPHVELRCDEY
jgi:hypothetical protein